MKKQKTLCSVKGCGRETTASGLCSGHYYRWRHYRAMYADVPLGKSSVPLPERRKRLAVPAGFKLCVACKHVKPLASFSRDKSRTQGCHPYCKICSRDKRLQHAYGATSQDYAVLLKQQNGRCALCNTKQPGKNRKYFDIDHNHETGAIRGLLCSYCNYRIVGIVEQRLKRQGASAKQLFAYLNGAYALKR